MKSAPCLLSRLTVVLVSAPALSSRCQETGPRLNYEAVPDFFQLPPGEHFVEPAGVAVNSKGHVFHRGKHPVMGSIPRENLSAALPTICLSQRTHCEWMLKTISGRQTS